MWKKRSEWPDVADAKDPTEEVRPIGDGKDKGVLRPTWWVKGSSI